MTKWQPDLAGADGPRYVAIAEALARDIDGGRLQAGDRLPTHRDLAWTLGVTIGTVSRAYAEAERRGLISGEVGRGTFVRFPPGRERLLLPSTLEGEEHEGLNDPHASGSGDEIKLNFAYPPPCGEDRYFAPALHAVAEDPILPTLFQYNPHSGLLRHRAAGAAWLKRSGVEVEPRHLILTAGAQNAIAVSLAAATKPGDRLLCAQLVYPGVQALARHYGLRLDGVAIDDEGIVPEALETACHSSGASALYVVPTFQNPTTAIMSEARRRAIVAVAERNGLTIIEDDIFGLLSEERHIPLKALAPERTIFLTSLSKIVAPALRIGYLAGPRAMTDRLATAMRALSWMATPLTAELATRWIEDGTADEILVSRRREARARRALALDILGPWQPRCTPGAIMLWLPLPEPWRSSDFAAEAQRRGVIVTPAEVCAVGRHTIAHAAKISLGPPRDRAELEDGLRRLAGLLQDGPVDAFADAL